EVARNFPRRAPRAADPEGRLRVTGLPGRPDLAEVARAGDRWRALAGPESVLDHQARAGQDVVRDAALARQGLDGLPGKLAGLGVCVLPAVDGRHGDRDLVGELLLRHAKPLTQAPNQVSRVLFHHILRSLAS